MQICLSMHLSVCFHPNLCLRPVDPEMLLFGDSSFNDAKNTSILNATIQYTVVTKRLDVPLTKFMKLTKM